MVADGTWSRDDKPSNTSLIEVFTSKSMWFSHYKPAFSKISQYPEMVKWLEDSDEKGSSLEVWGVEKANYSLVDLRKFVENGTLADGEKDELVDKKGKEREKKGKEKEGKGKEGHDLKDGSGKKSKKKVNKTGIKEKSFKGKQK
jgi:hypothetical protein